MLRIATRPMDLTKIFDAAVSQGASDVLLSAGMPAIFRVHGAWRPTTTVEFSQESLRERVFSLLTPEQIERLERERELDFSHSIASGHRFRANAFYQRGSLGAAFRLIANQIPTVGDLRLPPMLEELALAPQGLVLFTGPTGHGKSTTQAAMIDCINREERRHIVTIEDPIEYLHANKKSIVEQREVGSDTHSFSEALRHVLRQAPDVILIGEMRDLETISTAVTAGETGHLVMGTLHTNDAVQSIDRLLDVFPPHQQPQIRTQLSFCLNAVVAQRLLPVADGKGRIAAVEILVVNAAVKNLIREGKTHQIYSVMETHGKDGMVTMDAALKSRYLEGAITFDEARAWMRNPQMLAKSK